MAVEVNTLYRILALQTHCFYRPDAKYRYCYMCAACDVAGQFIFYNGIYGLT